MTRKQRRESVAEHSDPINFTCGICRQVHVFDSEKGLTCYNLELVEGDN